jgi:hypothetical protein
MIGCCQFCIIASFDRCSIHHSDPEGRFNNNHVGRNKKAIRFDQFRSYFAWEASCVVLSAIICKHLKPEVVLYIAVVTLYGAYEWYWPVSDGHCRSFYSCNR